MQSKLRFILLLLLISSSIFSCTKHDDPTVTPPQPEAFDTLGTGWQRIQVDATIDFEDIFFVNSQTGFLCGDKYLGKSIDGGLTWKSVIPDSLKQTFTNLFFLNANVGWATGSNFLLRTTDGGANWQKMYKGGTFDVQFFDADHGYITNLQPPLYKTSDGGLTLQPLVSGGTGLLESSGLFFLDQNTGWFANSTLNKTVNGGLSFLPNPPVVGRVEYAIQFTDSQHGWVAGGAGVYKTSDGGSTLETIFPIGGAGSDISFFDNNNGYILAAGKIYFTPDAGKTLTPLCSIHKSLLYEIHFTDTDHGWTTGTGGYVYRYVKP